MFLHHFFKKPTLFSPFLQSPFSRLYQTTALVNKLTPKEMLQTRPIKKLLQNTHFPGKIKRSQKGLFHGLRIQSGNQTCFSEKKTRRTWYPNIQEQWFYSDILKKYIRLQFTTKALRCMRKYGSFDNYILITKPEDLDSIYGEYLRRLMLTKLNNPSFKVPILSRSTDLKLEHRKKHYMIKPLIYYPPEMRDADKTVFEMKSPAEMNRDDARKLEEVSLMEDRFEDIPTSHPLMREVAEREEADIKKLEPDRKKIMERYDRMHKKKTLRQLFEFNKEAEEEFEKETELDYVNVREERRKKRLEGKMEKKEDKKKKKEGKDRKGDF